MIYLNMKTNFGVETVDEVDPNDFNTGKEFRLEVRRLISEYCLAGMNVYRSSRCTKDWSEK